MFKANSVAASASYQETGTRHLDATASIYGTNHMDTVLQEEYTPVAASAAYIPDARERCPGPMNVTPPIPPPRYRRKKQKSARLPAAKEHALIAEKLQHRATIMDVERLTAFDANLRDAAKCSPSVATLSCTRASTRMKLPTIAKFLDAKRSSSGGAVCLITTFLTEGALVC